jgi:PmbA protein
VNKELYTQHVQELSLNVVQTRVDSIRKKEVLRTGLRVYEGGKIGVAGALGRCEEADLTQRAISALELGIPYPYEIASGRKEAVEPPSDLPAGAQFVDEMQKMLAELDQAQPGFSFSNKINLRNQTVQLANDLGLDLKYRVTSIEVALVIKERGSANIFDAFAGYAGGRYDRAEFLRLANRVCDAFRSPVEIDEGTHPVLFLSGDQTYKSMLVESLHGQLYATGGSLFSGRMGQRLFADNFTAYESRNWQDSIIGPFFDAEGTVNEGHSCTLIQDGELAAVRTDKKNAARYGLPLTGSAGGEYDSVPSLGNPYIGLGNLQIASTGRTMTELLDGRKGILVWIAAGGDFTPEGQFATPVQLAYLFDGQRLLGRLPELSLSSHLYDMFGKDFIGVSTDSLTSLDKYNVIAMNMKVSKAA